MKTKILSKAKAQRAAETLNDPRWPEVTGRNAAADGSFYYSVATTGVYCRPSCAARPARPENVRFHPTRRHAEQAGFRPCKRCKPDQFDADLANRSAADVTGAAIQFAVGTCSLGALLVAQTRRGVCAILLGDDAGKLARDFQRLHPEADLRTGDPSLERTVAAVAAFVDEPARGLDLPLDLHGTAFQQRTWRALRRIPVGRTLSYAALAKKIGAPRAVRAVAQACAANSLAVAIPCHRVVRQDGAPSGYRWGLNRKRALLSREARA